VRTASRSSAREAHVVRRTQAVDEAEVWLGSHFRPNHLDLRQDRGLFNMTLSVVRVGALTGGRLSFGRGLRIRTGEARNFHINVTVRGRATSRTGNHGALSTRPGESVVFQPGTIGEIIWSHDCVQLPLMVPRHVIEAELQRLVDRDVTNKLDFAFEVPGQGPRIQPWHRALSLLQAELDRPTGLYDGPAGAHVEGLIIDGLLLGHRHNFSDRVDRRGPAASNAAIRRVIDLIEAKPGDPWTVVGLATHAHISVRALQEGFAREVGVPPMAYVRAVRLRRARQELREGVPESTTVRQVATRLGFLHLGRFAAMYRHEFGELPSATLRHDM
jgi:AraC-like DNA-binding protein